MGLETGTQINDLVVANPLATDPRSEGDDHLRLIKQILKNAFPGMNAAAYKFTDKAVGFNVAATDNLQAFRCTAALTIGTLAAATAGNGFSFLVIADGADVVIDPNGAETVNGATTLTIGDGDWAMVYCNGTAWYAKGPGAAAAKLASKATPVDADWFTLWDSVAGAFRKVTLTNLKAALKTYFDTLYGALATVNNWTKGQSGAVVALTDAATIAVDLSLGNNFSVTLAGNRTLGNPTNIVAGQSGIIAVTQDATGTRTLAYSSYYKFTSGLAPTLTTTANAVDYLSYYVESATRIMVSPAKDIK